MSNRPKYKEMYLKEKQKEKFSCNLLKTLVDMMNQIGLQVKLETRRRPDVFSREVLLTMNNPSNGLYGCIGINEDLLKGEMD